MRKKKAEVFIKQIEEITRFIKKKQKEYPSYCFCDYLPLVINYLKVLINWYKKV